MSDSRPNVLFLVSHDFGPDFGCYGNESAVTPNIDRLAARGVQFERHYCNWPLCGPSRANLFTGCRPLTTERFNNQPFFASFRRRTGFRPATMPEAFRAAGYTTRAFGFVYHDEIDTPSWSDGHTQVPEWVDPADRGGTDVPVRGGGHGDVPPILLEGWRADRSKQIVRERWHQLQRQGVTPEQLNDPAIARAARGPAVESYDGADESYPDGVAADLASQWLLDRAHVDEGARVDERARAPFFCAVGFVSGHTPFRAPARDWDLFDRGTLSLPDNLEPPDGSPEWAGGDCEPSQYYTTHGYSRPWRATSEQSRELLHGHLAALSYTDRQIGRILEALERAGYGNDTIVVVVSDHGFSDGHHGYWGKHNLWERSLSTPLILAAPGTAPARVSALTEHVDLFPTLCEMCGIAIPTHIEGDSFAPLLDSPQSDFKRAVFAHRKHMWHDRVHAYELATSMRTERYRYTRYVDGSGETIAEELFDYSNDPHERRNLTVDPTYGGALNELRAVMDAGWRAARPNTPASA